MELEKIEVEKTQLIDKQKYSKHAIQFMVYTSLGILLFFIPIGEENSIIFATLVDYLTNVLGNIWIWLMISVVVINAVLILVTKLFLKEGKIHTIYNDVGIFQSIFQILGAIFAVLWLFRVGPEFIIGDEVGGTIIDGIAIPLGWILILGGMLIPLFLKFGGLDFIGVLLQPIMRPVFKLPGKSGLDAMASFVGASTIGVYLTSRIYKTDGYTAREAAIIATCFSVVSVGFQIFGAQVLGLMPIFPMVFISTLIISFVISIIMARIPPLSRKRDIYYSGKEQTEEERTENQKLEFKLFKKALDKAVSTASKSDGIVKELLGGAIDGCKFIPRVLSIVIGAGVTALIIANYTPFFTWIGTPFVPLLQLLQIPNAVELAPSMLVGITEMYLPIILVSGYELELAAKFFLYIVTFTQIIYFSETAVVIMATGLPVKARELIIIFIERTLIAIPLAALAMHLLF